MTSIMLSRLNYNMLYTASHHAVKQQFITKMSMFSTISVKLQKKEISSKNLETYKKYELYLSNKFNKKKRISDERQTEGSETQYKEKYMKDKKSKVGGANSMSNVGNLVKLINGLKVPEAERMLKVLKRNRRFEFGVGLQVLMMDLYIKTEQCDLAMAQFSDMRLCFPSDPIHPVKTLELCILLLENEKDEECLKILADEAELHVNMKHGGDEEEEITKSPSLQRLSGRLLSVACERGEALLCGQLLALLISYSYATPTKALLGPCVRVHIRRKEFDSALTLLSQYAEEHKFLPCKAELLTQLVKDKDMKRTEVLVKLSTDILGRDNTIFDVVVCLVELQQLKKAESLLNSGQVVMSSARLLYQCEQHLKRENPRFSQDMYSVLCSSNAVSSYVLDAMKDFFEKNGIAIRSE